MCQAIDRTELCLQEAIGVVGEGCKCQTDMSFCDGKPQAGTSEGVDLGVSQWLILDAEDESLHGVIRLIHELGRNMDLGKIYACKFVVIIKILDIR